MATPTTTVSGVEKINQGEGKTSNWAVLKAHMSVRCRPDALPEQDPNLDNGWVVSDNLRVFAGHHDGFPVVWVDTGDTATAALSSGTQQRAEAALLAAVRRAEELADECNAAQQDQRDGLVANHD